MSLGLLILVPWIAVAPGALASALREPSPRITSAVQHLAAGVVFAAAAVEILPSLEHAGLQMPVLIAEPPAS